MMGRHFEKRPRGPRKFKVPGGPNALEPKETEKHDYISKGFGKNEKRPRGPRKFKVKKAKKRRKTRKFKVKKTQKRRKTLKHERIEKRYYISTGFGKNGKNTEIWRPNRPKA